MIQRMLEGCLACAKTWGLIPSTEREEGEMNLRRVEAKNWNAKPEVYSAQLVFGKPEGWGHSKKGRCVNTQMRSQDTSDPHKTSVSSLLSLFIP